ncbi:DUF2207 domain-containing protein [Natronosporangium hydrolyticum]|uniref:DUF2207 domain-containing protein n=1 Tax=Natronosporangium hydrolyticum TaxID=2811111 RepID=A0A895Y5P7_9ACTN|nr:DUF2207 domain-containing protein [Natronosporangium hydrolyticum]QSB13034.1 DUF2207 domain-containing protein [Natronosporangium hydrolyticum]
MSVTVFTVLLATMTGVWLVAYLALFLGTRTRGVRAAPASPDLGPEPPAVVNLLVNRWRLTPDAAEATLLDLAARGWLELRQTGHEPRNTTVHLRQPGNPGPILPFEARILDRVRQLAVAGVVPVTALTFRDPRRAAAWQRQLHREIVADARARGLSRGRFSPAVQTALSSIAGVAAVVPFGAAVLQGSINPVVLVLAMAITVGISTAMNGLANSERDTPTGRAAASRWLGVRSWLRGHEEFAQLPPAAVTLWQRYLAYGAALGVTRTTSAVLDLGMGDDRRVWSAYQGHWRRVRIRYPRLRPHYGRSLPGLLLQLLVLLFIAAVLSRFGSIAAGLADSRPAPAPIDTFGLGALVISAALAGYALYTLARGVIELAQPRTITGEVLWSKVARTRKSKHGRQGEPLLYHLAVDSGGVDTTTAWGLPAQWAHDLHPGDIAELTVRPWSRRITGYRVLRPGPRRSVIEPVAVP